MRSYAIATLGCKVNQYESERLKKDLACLEAVGFGEPADIYIINSCGVTAEAEAKARQLVRRAKRLSPAALIVLCGCWAPGSAEMFQTLGVDLMVGNSEKPELAARLGLETTFTEPVKPPTTRVRVFIKAQDGCNDNCAYCLIPKLRGAPVSRTAAAIISEINEAVAKGAAEIVLTGVHLGKYGIDDGGRASLSQLISEILRSTDCERIRLSSIEPQEIGPELQAVIFSSQRIARHLHIPLQSGSDRILRAMNRRYTISQFSDLLAGVRKSLPDVGITSDIIAGFPGESAADFHETIRAIDSCAFSRLHVFKFSPRPGTSAAEMEGRVKPAVVSARATAAKTAGLASAARFASRFAGRLVSVLVEPDKDGRQLGLTSEYLRVKFDQPVEPVGKLVTALVTGVDTKLLTVELIRSSHG